MRKINFEAVGDLACGVSEFNFAADILYFTCLYPHPEREHSASFVFVKKFFEI